jgi:hypothetical protein
MLARDSEILFSVTTALASYCTTVGMYPDTCVTLYRFQNCGLKFYAFKGEGLMLPLFELDFKILLHCCSLKRDQLYTEDFVKIF